MTNDEKDLSRVDGERRAAGPTGSTASSNEMIRTSAEWSLSDALDLIRTIQPRLHERNWHVALAGGVLNNGSSMKDLDLVFLPFNDGASKTDILPFLCELWGEGRAMGEAEYDRVGLFSAMAKFYIGPRRIDAFVGQFELLKAVDAVDPQVADSGKLSTRA